MPPVYPALRRTVPGAALALGILLTAAQAHARSPEIRDAEVDGDDLELCMEDAASDLYTLRIDVYSERIRGPIAGCRALGDGLPLSIEPDPGRPGSVALIDDVVFYVAPGRLRVIPLRLDRARHFALYPDSYEPDPYESDEVDEPRGSIEPDGPSCESDSCNPRDEEQDADEPRPEPRRRAKRLSTYEPYRVPIPGPRAAEVGDIAGGETLNGLERTLDPVLEPAIVGAARGSAAVVGVATGIILYPITLLEVLSDELAPPEDSCDSDRYSCRR